MNVILLAAAVAVVGTTTPDGEQLAEPWERCARAKTEITQYIRATQSCSEAIFVRRSQNEADAICWAARSSNARNHDFLVAVFTEGLAKGTPMANDGCYERDLRGLTATYRAALQWHIDWLGYRISHQPRTISAFNLDLQKLYASSDIRD